MGKLIEKLTGYRTAIISGITTIVGILVTFGVVSPEIAGFISANANTFYGAVITLLGVVFGGLRLITTTPIGEK